MNDDIIDDKAKIVKNKIVRKYNETQLDEIKESFLAYCKKEGYQDATITNYRHILNKTQVYETKGRYKEFENFSKNDLLSLMTVFSSSSFRTLSTYKSCYEMFYNFAIKTKVRYSDNNPATEITSDDLKKMTYDSTKEMYVTRDEIYEEVIPYLNNPVEKMLILLIYEGIRGRKACSELINLKHSDINEENKSITVQREYNEEEKPLTLKITDERFWDVYRELKKETQDFYVEQDTYRDHDLYTDNDYVFKPRRRQKNGGLKISYAIVHRMINLALNSYEVNRPEVTINSLYNSGMFERLMDEEELQNTDGKGFTYTQAKEVLIHMRESVSEFALFKEYEKFKKKFY